MPWAYFSNWEQFVCLNKGEPYFSWIVYNSEVCSMVINDAVRCWGLNRISEQQNIMAYDWSSYMGELVLKRKSKNLKIKTKKFVIEYDEM